MINALLSSPPQTSHSGFNRTKRVVSNAYFTLWQKGGIEWSIKIVGKSASNFSYFKGLRPRTLIPMRSFGRSGEKISPWWSFRSDRPLKRNSRRKRRLSTATKRNPSSWGRQHISTWFYLPSLLHRPEAVLFSRLTSDTSTNWFTEQHANTAIDVHLIIDTGSFRLSWRRSFWEGVSVD